MAANKPVDVVEMEVPAAFLTNNVLEIRTCDSATQ
jgi:hypothetical protein